MSHSKKTEFRERVLKVSHLSYYLKFWGKMELTIIDLENVGGQSYEIKLSNHHINLKKFKRVDLLGSFNTSGVFFCDEI